MKGILLFLVLSPVIAHAQPAGGEDCASATLISSLPFTGSGTTTGHLNDYFAVCQGGASSTDGAPDVVYRYTTGNTTETIDVSLCQALTNYDAKLIIYEAACSGAPFRCSEDVCSSPALAQNWIPRLDAVPLSANTTYYFVIDGYDASESGDYQININRSASPEITFTNKSTLLTTTSFSSGNAVGIADMNNDGYDDIIRARSNNQMYINYQQPDGSFTETAFSNTIGTPWSMCVGDIDNDGYNDVLWGSNGSVRILMAENNGSSFNTLNLGGGIFSQGSNFFDVDNDGILDAFVCNDVGTSNIYVGDGTGDFVNNQALLPMATVPSSDNSGNYASIWTDVNGDNRPDLYITKCRQGVTNNTDPRRINQLFINNGDGTFTQDVADVANLRIGAQSWASDFADIDNDGDLDVFVFNYDVPPQILLNDGNGVFTDITSSTGILPDVNFFGMNVFFEDFNNDTYIDILLSGDQHRLYINNGDNTFRRDINAFEFNNNDIAAFAVGDLNHDGFRDIYASYTGIYNNPSSSRRDKLWMNEGASGYNHLTVTLKGVQSNRNGIGAKIVAYGPWGIQVREVRSGEGYGIQNSFSKHFGLKNYTQADSLFVYWPSGTVDQLNYVQANQFIEVIEGSSPVSVTEQKRELALKVYPNPVQDVLVFELGQTSDFVQAYIRDITGKVVAMPAHFRSGYNRWDCASLAPGVYTYELYSGKERLKTGKFVKQ